MSLRERIRGLKDKVKDKDLDGLLKNIEDSYVLKGIDWVDDTLKLKGYESKSHAWYEKPLKYAAKSLNFLRDVFLYGNIGMLPGDKQEKYTQYLEYDNLKFTRYSLFYGFTIDAIRFAAALSAAGPVAFGLYTWGFVSFVDDSTRFFYALIKKKPIGSFVYAEIPYRIIKPLFEYITNPSKKKYKKQELIIEKENKLNNNTTLNLS